MALEQRPNEQVDFGNTELVDISDPVAPHGLPEAERKELNERAKELVKELSVTEGAREMELLDNLGNVGMKAQRSSASQLDLLRVRVGEMLSEDATEDGITGSLVDLRLVLNQINPTELGKPGVLRSFAAVFPFVDSNIPPLKVLQKIALRYEPVSRQIEIIEAKLREGRMVLTRDNVELRQVYEQVEEQRLPIQKNAYLGELLMVELQELLDNTDDSAKADRIREALHDVAIRVQNLRVMDGVYEQFFVGIEMTRRNNARLNQAVEQTLSVATNTMMVGLAIQAALARQRQVMEANVRTREFIGDMIVANASAIRRHTEEIGEVYNNPVIAMDKITTAHQELVEAVDTANRLKQEGIEVARDNITKLGQLASEFQQRTAALQQPALAESIEA